MDFSDNGLVRYLIDRDLVDAGAVVDGAVVAVPARRRNHNLRLTCGAGRPGYFIKRVSAETGAGGTSLLPLEAAFYWLVQTRPALAELRHLLPVFREYDPANGILILDLVLPAESVAERQSRLGGRYPVELGAALGRALATIHASSDKVAAAADGLIPAQIPWVIAQLEGNARLNIPVNPGTDFVLDAVYRYPGFVEALRALRADWTSSDLIHGDIKWDNLLLVADRPDAAGPDLVVPINLIVTDWELVSFGDRAWDLGSVFQDYLSHVVLSLPLQPATPPDRVRALAERPLGAIRPAVGAFWRSYSDACGPIDARTRRRSAGCAGARMIQTSVEYMNVAKAITPNVALLLQLGHNMLQSPDEAAAALLGL